MHNNTVALGFLVFFESKLIKLNDNNNEGKQLHGI